MVPKSKPTIEERAVLSAERALASQKFVSAVDVLVNMGFVAATHAENWRKGRLDYLEQFIQASPNKVARALATFHRWAKERGLTPSESRYVVEGRAGTRELRFTATGEPEAERAYRTQYLAPDLPERKKKQIEEVASKAPERVVFSIVRDSSLHGMRDRTAQGQLPVHGRQPPAVPGMRGSRRSGIPPQRRHGADAPRVEVHRSQGRGGALQPLARAL